eukprot:TRINITY_DN6860_c0_g1_i1.p1 TRINITY_DN6860_c0_g1~~TRINITY_DN6860_c0_g1_i1.p1  ORF type:complete len:557 (+),score=119.60 TRINITY_DN6860_c0_g1_i1:241-1911(+)
MPGTDAGNSGMASGAPGEGSSLLRGAKVPAHPSQRGLNMNYPSLNAEDSSAVSHAVRISSDMASQDKEHEHMLEELSEHDQKPDPEPTWSIKLIPLLISAIVGAVVFFLPIPFLKAYPHAQRCACMLSVVAVNWATESIPLYCTGFLVVVLTVYLRVLINPDGSTMIASASASLICEMFWDPLIFLFLGGYTIAAALHKYGLNKRLANYVLALAGTKPMAILFACMALSVFLSMWISNVASAVLCTSSVLPILHKMPPTSKFPKALLLGIAFANNIGGMTTPIASPQNAIALKWIQYYGYNISFLHWMMVSVPFCISALFMCWLVTWYVIRPTETYIEPIQYTHTPLHRHHWFILVTVLATVCLWIAETWIPNITGNIGITALFPVIVFFGTGLLTVQDFDSLAWNVLMLMGGGLALGFAIQNSMLLEVVTEQLKNWLANADTWITNLVFASLVVFVGSFISSTVAAIIICPVLASLGDSIDHVRLLVVTGAVMCSGAMMLPVSSFPNANSFSISDADHRLYLTVLDYIKAGVPCGLCVLFLVQTIGFLEMTYMGW